MEPALLERWMRDYYFSVEIDLGSSGVQDYSLEEIRRLTDLTHTELDDLVMRDSRTLGDPGLRQALAHHLGLEGPEFVVPTHGSSEAIFLVMQTLLEPGDEVVVLDPCYQQLFAFAAAGNSRLLHWPLRFDQQFVVNFDALEGLIGPNTRMVVVNFPHNPTGATIKVEQQARLVRLASRVGAYLLWDSAFARLTYDAPPLSEPIALYERAISLGTLSKTYGMPGLRVGWCVGAPEILQRFAHLRDYTILHLSPLVERIAQRVFEKAEALLAPRRRQAVNNRELVASWIAEQRGRIEWVPPQGGVSCFPRLPHVSNVDAFCRRLAAEAKVMLVPGSCFGHPQHVRLGFGGPTEELREGLARVSDFL